MKSLQKHLVWFVLILFISGCGTTIKTVITSDPSGALIYSGETANNMSYLGPTPMTFKHHDNKPYWNAWYYQIRKPGYEDSELIIKPQGEIGADRHVHAKLKPLSEKDTSVADAVESEPIKYIKKIFVKDKNNIYSEQGFEGKLIKTVDIGTMLTVIQKDGDWNKIKTDDGKIGWVHNKAIVEDKAILIKDLENKVKQFSADNMEGNLEIYEKLLKLDPGNNKYKEKVEYCSIKLKKELEDKVKLIPADNTKANLEIYEKLLKLDPGNNKYKEKVEYYSIKSEDENLKCAEIQRLSAKLMSFISKRNFDKHNEISLKILSLMEELHTAGSDKQIPDCNQVVHLAFSRKATVSFSGKGLIDREDARIKYKMSAKAPAILQIDFTVFPTSTEIMGYGFLIMTDVSCSSTHVEFKGVLREDKGKWVNATQFEWRECPNVTMAGSKMVIEPYSSVPYTTTVEPPKVTFYSNKRPLPSYPSAYPFDRYWSRIRLTEQDLQKAFEKGHLTLRRKTKTESLSGTVTIDFAPPDPKLQASGPSNPEGIGLWGDRTTHGGFLLATEKGVFSDDHPVAKEGDPVLCPIHGLSKVSRDESSGVYIGDKTVAVSGGKADCGAKILSGSTMTIVQPVKQ
jgi:uncharacterized Zn-binding protein involved in type VI secretion/uncharacterized protein YgiM (DUF1202 family)